RALEFEVPKGHVPKLAGIVERVMSFDLHAAQSMGLPGVVDRKVAGLGTGYNRDLYAQFTAATPTDLDLPYIVGFVGDYVRSRQAELRYLVKKPEKESIGAGSRTDGVPIAAVGRVGRSILQA